MSSKKLILEPPRGVGGLSLGMSRAEAEAWLAANRLEFYGEEDDCTWLDLADHELELRFEPEPPHRLIGMGVSEEEIKCRGGAVVGVPLARALDVLRFTAHEETTWLLGADPLAVLDDAETGQLSERRRATDEQLLDGGTLWLRPLALGLHFDEGRVHSAFLVAPEAIPHDGCGPLTTEQLRLAERDDLVAYLRRTRRRRRSLFRNIATVLFVLALLVLARQVWLQQQREANAPTVEGTVVAQEPAAGPSDLDTYTVRYEDEAGAAHEVKLTIRDLYVPREIGEQVPITYFPEKPAEGFGPARLRDSAFLTFVPWFLGVFAVYTVALGIDPLWRSALPPFPGGSEGGWRGVRP